MEVRVIVKKWGNYSKGDTLDIPVESTAFACIKTGDVEATVVKKVDPKEPKTVVKKVDPKE